MSPHSRFDRPTSPPLPGHTRVQNLVSAVTLLVLMGSACGGPEIGEDPLGQSAEGATHVSPDGLFDIDASGKLEKASDCQLVVRWLFGFRSYESFMQDVDLPARAQRTDRFSVYHYLVSLALSELLDIDGNGELDALTDGVLLCRYISGTRGTALVQGAVAPDGLRTRASQVQSYIDALKLHGPVLDVSDLGQHQADGVDALLVWHHLRGKNVGATENASSRTRARLRRLERAGVLDFDLDGQANAATDGLLFYMHRAYGRLPGFAKAYVGRDAKRTLRQIQEALTLLSVGNTPGAP